MVSRISSILIAEDSVVQRRHLAALCEQLGVQQVHQAANGAEALALLERLDAAPDAMVIDLEMPVMDGVELIQSLQQRDIRIPYVIASMRENALLTSVLEMARAHGHRVGGALRKPLTLAPLKKALSACMEEAGKTRPRAPAQPVDPQTLRLALERGELRVHYQPKVDIQTGLIRGAEVLARWPDPAGGFIAPDRFIPVAEANGLIHALTLQVLDQACAQAARWKAKGLALSLAVNLSPLLLDSRELVGEIGRLVARHRVRPEELVFEITEGALISSEGMALGTLARLRMHGYGLAIDDYGTGFSSMQQLSRIPFTELKIDRRFVHGAHADEHLRVLLHSAIEMAGRLGLTSVAEGVETTQDWALLRRYGCNVGQGWLIGKAMPAEDLPGWLRQHRLQLSKLRSARATSFGEELM